MKFLAVFIIIIFLLNSSCKKESHKPMTPNSPPVAKAGPDILIALPDDSALLSGKSSYDPDNGDSIVSYEWKKINGPATYSIDNKNDAETKVRNLIEGVYVFELTVKDKGGLSSKDRLNIKVLRSRNELIFEQLTWRQNTDSIGHMLYMRTPALPSGYSTDSIVSVYIWRLDFDLGQSTWMAVSKGGFTSNRFYFKVDDNTVIVYSYTSSVFGFFVGNSIRVVFK